LAFAQLVGYFCFDFPSLFSYTQRIDCIIGDPGGGGYGTVSPGFGI
jgi:hypothetical protein